MVLKNFISILGGFLSLQACYNLPEPSFPTEDSIPQRLSPYVLWQTYRGSACAAGLPQSTILKMARVAQNLFATGQRGQKVVWTDAQANGEIVLIYILPKSTVPCLKYGQKIVLPQETRYAQGIACINSADVWQIVEENPVDPKLGLF